MARTELTLEQALLGYLYEQPRHGYDIHQQILAPDGLGLVWQLKQSQTYALLTKLEQQGYISATLEMQETRPPRKVLALTPMGRAAFLHWLQSPVPQGRKMRLEFMAKFYFARQIIPTQVRALIKAQHGVCQAWLTSLHTQADELTPDHPFEQLVHQFRIGQVEAMIQWLEVCENTWLITAESSG